MKAPLSHTLSRKGAALVVTLLIVALITTILIAYLQLVDAEKASSLAVSNRYRATLAAEAGISTAQAQIAALFKDYPDSAIGWAKLEDLVDKDETGPEMSVFYFRTTDDKGFLVDGSNAAFPSSQPQYLNALPLVSGANSTLLSNFERAGSVFPTESPIDKVSGLTANNSINLNRDNWIGTPLPNPKPSTTPPPPVIRARWVEILQDPTKDKNTDGSSPQFNPPIARFAFYLEDQSFKVNINTVNATASGRGDKTPGASPQEGILQAVLPEDVSKEIDAQIRTHFLPKPTPKPPAKVKATIPTLGTIGLASSANQTTVKDNKFILTTQSSALDISRGGALRLNLNQVVQDVDFGDPESAQEIRSQLDRIISAIDNQYAMPDFGERFFRTTSITDNATYLQNINQEEVQKSGLLFRGVPLGEIYVQRIAANIMDFIDENWVTTVIGGVDDDGTIPNSNPRSVRVGRPNFALGDPNVDGNTANSIKDADFIATGKEGIQITEFACRAVLKKMDPPIRQSGQPDTTTADFDFEVYFYVEIYNPTNREISISELGPNPFLKIHSLFDWDVGPNGEIEQGDGELVQDFLTVPLSQFQGLDVIPANGFVVLCTENESGKGTSPFTQKTNFYYAESSAIKLRGKTNNFLGIQDEAKDYWSANGYPNALSTGLYSVESKSGNDLHGRSGDASTAANYDADVQVVIGSDHGTLDSLPSILLGRSRFEICNKFGDAVDSPDLWTKASKIKGHTSIATGDLHLSDVFTSGDPRAQNEFLRIKRYSPGSEKEKHLSRTSWGGTSNENSLGNGDFTLGRFNPSSDPNPPANPVGPSKKWADHSVKESGIHNAPYTQLNAKLDSVGRLGEIFDPVKVMEEYDSERIFRVRHGGRTLKIGQTEKYDSTLNRFGLWDGAETSVSRNWTAWRLADVFSNKFPTEDTNSDGAVDAEDGFTGNDRWQTEGLVNLNGVARDGGLALRTVLRGFQFTGEATGLAGESLSETEVDTIVNAVLEHLQNGTPLDPSRYRLFWERGQLSELLYREGSEWRPFFSTGNKLGPNMSTVYDRAKEELFRRCVELFCTKGNTFTVYSIGQSLNPVSGKAVSTSRKKSTFRIMPDYEVPNSGGVPFALPADHEFDPSGKNSEINDSEARRGRDRFRRPTRFLIVKLSEQNE